MASRRKITVFFDIGHTLAVGGEMSPRRLIGYRLGLSEEDIKTLGKFIMTAPLETREDLFIAIKPFVKHLEASKVELVLNEIWNEQNLCVELLPGAEEVIVTLAGRGYDLGLVSNIWHPFYEGVNRKASRIWHYFKHVVVSYRAGIKKPDRRIYRLARELSQTDECWMVGDTYEMDILPAKTEGFKTVWFLIRPERERDNLARVLRGEIPAPDFAVADLRELVQENGPFPPLME